MLHAFRHTYGSTLANTGIDSFRIQKVMGRKSIQTTEKYVQVADSALEALLRLSRSVTNSVIRGLKESMESGSYQTVNSQVPGSSPSREPICIRVSALSGSCFKVRFCGALRKNL